MPIPLYTNFVSTRKAISFCKIFQVHRRFGVKFEFQGEERYTNIDNLKRTLIKYLQTSWPGVAESTDHLQFLYEGKPIDIHESVGRLNLRKDAVIVILGHIIFEYRDEIQRIKIENSNHSILNYIKKTKWKFHPEYLQCCFLGQELNMHKIIRSLNLSRNNEPIKLFDSKDINISVMPFGLDVSLKRVVESTTISNVKGNYIPITVIFDTAIFCTFIRELMRYPDRNQI